MRGAYVGREGTSVQSVIPYGGKISQWHYCATQVS